MKNAPVTSRLWLFAVLLATALAGCQDDYITPGEVDTSYFPLEVGSYIVYQLDSVVYDDFTMTVNSRSLLVREIMESAFIDASGDTSYRVERQYREDENSAWGSVGYDIWFASMDGLNGERIEENQRYIKLVFPISVGLTWPGNTHINVDPNGPLGYLQDWNYSIATLHEPMTMGLLSFDSTLTVIQESRGTVIDTVGAREVYAKHIGLIYKELFVLESQCTSCAPSDIECIIACQNQPWEMRAEKGFIVKQRILEYGTL